MNSKTNTIYECSMIYFPIIGDRRGNISPLENLKNIPFDVKRVFYVYDIPAGKDRGGHAHKELHEILIAVSGSFEIMVNDGQSRKSYTLNRPFMGFHLQPGIWAEEYGYSAGAVCLVLCSDVYLEDDYIKDYNEFLKYKEIIK